ncbi:MAG: 4-alpha-glucanotransferase [Spirochaetales bacterium]|nr:MAG: 4-alpha-glucanotransferase [Spirochaetales bacterium]
MNMQRTTGILLHPTSLPGPYGIGDLGAEAERFIEWLAAAGQGVWQVLPLGPTGYGDSPYAPFSSFAGNELLISPDKLAMDDLVTSAELVAIRQPASDSIDYGTTIPAKKNLIRTASRRFIEKAATSERAAFTAFRREHSFWLDDFILFMDIKEEFDAKAASKDVQDSSWNRYWPREYAVRDQALLMKRRQSHAVELEIRAAAQFLFYKQWDALRSRASKHGVGIVGDLPIFVAMDSADAWSRPELFDLDPDGRPIEVAGVPPDYFSADGQLWGNPLYAWDRHRAEGFSWWLSRIEASLRLYDTVRIDHFRGLDAYWAVPAGEDTARKGTWSKAPGHELLSALQDRLGGDVPIIAEDLGFITEDVQALRDDFSLPGMRVLQFAFDAKESGTDLNPNNPFLPHNYVPKTVVYTGTHDNDTLAGWLASATPIEIGFIDDYLGSHQDDRVRALIREALKSVAALAVFPAQDILGLGKEARMNTPSTLGGNWQWRLTEGQLTPELASEIRAMACLYGRVRG